jgi:hypothetical protein
MHTGHPPTAHRRSSRVSTALPILVTTLAGAQFSEVCKTLVVNAHGCALLSPVKFENGVPLRFHRKDGRETTARVVSCLPMGSDNGTWRLGAQLEWPENFWGLTECPEDWANPALPAASSLPQIASPSNGTPQKVAARVGLSPEATLDLVAQRLEAPMRRMIAESLSPLQAEIKTVKETLARREANPSRFEVSLSSIPPELEQQLEIRLQKHLGPTVLEDSRNQYAQLLETAKAMIDRRMSQGCDDFTRRATEELKSVERRAQDVSANISAKTQEQMRHGLEDFRQKLLDGGNSLKRLSEELCQYLQQNLNDEHNVCRADLERIRASAIAESSRLRKEVESLDSRIAKLNESAHSLESGLDKRLGVLASNTMKDVRSQLDSVTNGLLEELTAQSLRIVEDRLVEASEKVAAVQKEVVGSVSELLDVQKTNALQVFEHSMDEMAQLSVERWRLKLSTGLNAVAKSVGDQFLLEAESVRAEKGHTPEPPE